MADHVLHAKTARQFAVFIEHPTQVMLLSGPRGIGKGSLAKQLAAAVLQVQATEDQPYIKLLAAQEGTRIGIDDIRAIESFLSLKVPREGAFNRAIIIEDGEQLTLEAQNALLKTLEEPPEGTIIVLTVSHPQALLPTVRSRTQVLQVLPPTIDDLKQYFSQAGYSKSVIDQGYAMSAGLPGLMTALLENADHPLLLAVEEAKHILRANTYERLVLVDGLVKQKPLAEQCLAMLQQMAHLSLLTAEGKAAERWQKILEAAYNASEALDLQVPPKLVLTKLFLQL